MSCERVPAGMQCCCTLPHWSCWGTAAAAVRNGWTAARQGAARLTSTLAAAATSCQAPCGVHFLAWLCCGATASSMLLVMHTRCCVHARGQQILSCAPLLGWWSSNFVTSPAAATVATRCLVCWRRSDAADAATAEKQVALLTRGLAHHPGSSALLLALLRSYAVIAPDAAALADKWRAVLARQGGSWVLWREFLAQR